MFQDKQEKEASNKVFELSEGISLNEPLVTLMVHRMKQKNRTQILNQSQEELLILFGPRHLHQMDCLKTHWLVL